MSNGNWLTTAAYHESGHMVAGAAVGWPVGEIWIIRDGTDETGNAQARCGTYWHQDNEPLNWVVETYGGLIAQWRYPGRGWPEYAKEDYEHIRIALRAAANDVDQQVRLRRRARRRARVLVDRHWGAVEALGTALLGGESEYAPGCHRLWPHQVQRVLGTHGLQASVAG